MLGPLIANFGEKLTLPVCRPRSTRRLDQGLIRNMEPGDIKGTYLRYIGAGAVAAGGIISMFRALPLIIASIVSGPARPAGQLGPAGAEVAVRTERDLSDDGRPLRQPRPWCSS